MNFKPITLRIFVYEYITGGGLIHEAIPASLAQEGEMMLRALIRDLLEIPGIEVVTSRDFRLPQLDLPVVVFTVRDVLHAGNIFNHCVTETDATWLVAPESSDTLERLSRDVLTKQRILVGSSPEAIAIAANKLNTARLLSSLGIAVVPTYLVADKVMKSSGQWVAKPKDGQGCVETRLFGNYANAVDWIGTTNETDNYVLQPFITGEACSLSMLCRDREAILLGCNRQNVVIREGRFYYLGGEVNAIDRAQANYPQLANDVASALPGLWGYVGVDFISTENGPVVLEINPRLTTSYVGLRASLDVNPAALVLSLFDDAMAMPVIQKKSRPITVEIEACHVD